MGKFILFDFDGVIVDSFAHALEVNQKICPHITADEYRKGFEGNINEWGGLKSNHTDQCRTDIDFFAEYVPNMEHIKVVAGMEAVISELAKFYTLVIVSSTITMPIKDLISRTGLKDYFVKILGNDVHKSKVEKIKMIFKEYQIGQKDCVFITDTLGDIYEAVKMEVGVLAVSWGFHSHETLQRGNPAKIIDSPEKLFGAVNDYFS